MEELEFASLDVALAVGDECEHRLLGDVLVIVLVPLRRRTVGGGGAWGRVRGAIGGGAGTVGGVVLLELGPLERRRVGHGARGGGRLEDGAGIWKAKRPRGVWRGRRSIWRVASQLVQLLRPQIQGP